MKKEDIKKIMIVHNDNDFVRVFDYIGKLLLFTLTNKNVCFEEMLIDSDQIEQYIFNILPVAIQTAQRESIDMYGDGSLEQLKYLVNDFTNTMIIKYNFDENDLDYEFGGSETLIIDLEKKESYIR